MSWWRFPVAINLTGGISSSQLEENVRESMFIVIGTAPGERVQRKDFGCRIWELLFAPNDSATWTMAGHHVREALGWWEPRIEVDDVRTTADPGNPAAVEVEVDYTIRATHDRRSLVFPFYLIPDEPAAAAAKVAETAAAMAEPGSVPAKAPVRVGSAPAPTATGRAPSPSSRSARSSAGPKEASR